MFQSRLEAGTLYYSSGSMRARRHATLADSQECIRE